ncbi:MAG: Mur ligase family protein [Candidatus Diapherotrites archaeon]
MNYESALKFLNKLKNPHRGFGLDNVRELAARAGAYSAAFTVVHVTGTNGKGSTTAMVAQILGQKHRAGMYTSPHLLEVRERIRVNGGKIPKREFAALLSELRHAAKAMRSVPTYFEYMTAMAILYFMRKGVEVAVIEVGLGGRLDATNIMRGTVNVITDISLEHTETLGKTVQKIAREKGGIIKRGSVTVVMRDNAGFGEISKIARARRSKIIVPRARAIPRIGLQGRHQLRNAALAVAAVKALREFGISVSENEIKKGLAEVKWPGRMQVVGRTPLVVADVAHNPGGCAVVARALKEPQFRHERLIIVFGCVERKDFRKMLRVLPFDYAIISQPKNPRALAKGKVAQFLGQQKRARGKYELAASINAALKKAKKIAGKKDLILVCGSHYTVAEVLGKPG